METEGLELIDQPDTPGGRAGGGGPEDEDDLGVRVVLILEPAPCGDGAVDLRDVTTRPGPRSQWNDASRTRGNFSGLVGLFARDTVAAEKTVNTIPREEQGKAALTELFESLKNDDTPLMVERVVADIDDVVKAVRFEGWQETRDGDRSVQQALRKTLYLKYKIRDQDIFDRAYGYIREYY
jgi:hypothetical protein